MSGQGQVRIGSGTMMHQISREVDYVLESVSLLQHIGAGDKYEEMRESLGRKYGNPFREGLRKFELLGQIEQAAERAFADDLGQLQYYFPVRGDTTPGCVGKLVILWEDFKKTGFRDIASYEKHLTELSEQEYCETFGSCLQAYAEPVVRDTYDTARMSEPYAVICSLMKMEIADEEKWKIQKVFFDRAEHIEKVLGFLRRAEALLLGFHKELEELAEMFYQYWTRQLAGQEFSAYISERTKISVGDNPLGYCLQASIIWFNGMLLERDSGAGETDYNAPDYYRIGILFGEDFDLGITPGQQKEGFEGYAMQVLKLLADKSKFQILAHVRDEAAYGSELAKRLELTTATVSHHMNALLAAGLVEVRHVENRVYYTANKEALKEVLEYCMGILT